MILDSKAPSCFQNVNIALLQTLIGPPNHSFCLSRLKKQTVSWRNNKKSEISLIFVDTLKPEQNGSILLYVVSMHESRYGNVCSGVPITWLNHMYVLYRYLKIRLFYTHKLNLNINFIHMNKETLHAIWISELLPHLPGANELKKN